MQAAIGDAQRAATCGTSSGRKRIGLVRVGGADASDRAHKERTVIQRPTGIGAFQFVILATLRAAQLLRGCQPRENEAEPYVATKR